MIKPGLALLTVLSLMTPAALKHGCRDLKLANTSIPYGYYPTRDMRHSIALVPQRFYRLPDSTSVPITGREPRHDQEISPEERDAFASRFVKRSCISASARSYGGGPTQPFSFSTEPASRGTSAENDGAVGSHWCRGRILPSITGPLPKRAIRGSA